MADGFLLYAETRLTAGRVGASNIAPTASGSQVSLRWGIESRVWFDKIPAAVIALTLSLARLLPPPEPFFVSLISLKSS